MIERKNKTGKVIKEQYYTRHISQQYGEVLERDGKFFHPNGKETVDPRAVVPVVASAPAPSVEKKIDPAKK
jgi:hypothetical protein